MRRCSQYTLFYGKKPVNGQLKQRPILFNLTLLNFSIIFWILKVKIWYFPYIQYKKKSNNKKWLRVLWWKALYVLCIYLALWRADPGLSVAGRLLLNALAGYRRQSRAPADDTHNTIHKPTSHITIHPFNTWIYRTQFLKVRRTRLWTSYLQ